MAATMGRLTLARPLVGLTLATSVVVASAWQGTPPQFRAGVTLTRLEVTVLDRKTRIPVTGLTANDFVVKVDGRAQPIVSLAEVSVPGVARVTAPGIVDAAHDVASNQLTAPRLFVIIMNDAIGGADPSYSNTARAIARRVIDLLGPDDLASVIFVRDNREAQDFVQDRVLLRRAVDTYRSMDLDRRLAKAMATMVLLRTLEFLRPMSDYRRAVVFVSPADRGQEVLTDDLKEFTLHQATLDERDEVDLAAVSGRGPLARVPVYTFSAQGLPAPTSKDIAATTPDTPVLAWFDDHVATLRAISDLTGGRATVATNTPADGVSAMFSELSSYYAVAYEPTDPSDGRLRRLDVQVTRPNALVVSSRYVHPSADVARSSPSVRSPSLGTGLKTGLESPLPLGQLSLRLSVIPLATTSARQHALVMTLGLPIVKGPERFRVRVLAFDGEGRKQFLDTARTVDLARASDGESSEVLIRSDLPTGRYNVRVAVERASDGVAGSVQATLEVPDFARAALALSGVAMGRGNGGRISGRQEIDGLLPFAPTAVRAFAKRDRVGALLRVHQASNRPVAVTMTTSISDALGATISTRSDMIPPTAFVNGAAEHRFEVPLSDLVPGLYLLRFVATTGATSVQREVRFAIR